MIFNPFIFFVNLLLLLHYQNHMSRVGPSCCHSQLKRPLSPSKQEKPKEFAVQLTCIQQVFELDFFFSSVLSSIRTSSIFLSSLVGSYSVSSCFLHLFCFHSTGFSQSRLGFSMEFLLFSLLLSLFL